MEKRHCFSYDSNLQMEAECSKEERTRQNSSELVDKKAFQIKKEGIMSGKRRMFLPSSAKARMTTAQIASPLCQEMLCT